MDTRSSLLVAALLVATMQKISPQGNDHSLPEWDLKSDPLSEEEQERFHEKLKRIVDPMVSEILYELELRDYQIEPMKDELQKLFVGRGMLLNLMNIEVEKAGKNLTKGRNAARKVNNKRIDLHSKSRKAVRQILGKAKLIQYNRTIRNIALIPRMNYPNKPFYRSH